MQKFIGMVLGILSISLVVSACDELSVLTGNCQDQKAQAYTIGTQVDGELSITDCVVTEGSTNYVDYYKFTLDKQQDVTFYYQPESYDRSWSLINSEDKAIITNTSDRTKTQQLAAGNYRIVVKASSSGKIGKYVLSTTTPEKGFGGCQDLPTIDLGTTVNGELDIRDCFALSGLYIVEVDYRVDYYEFVQAQSQPENVTIDLRTSEIGLGWYLYNRGGTRVFSSARNTETEQLAPGNYVIAVTDRGNLGKYEITTTTSTKGFAGCLTLPDYALGTSVNGVLEITDCQAANSNSYVDYYTFTLPQQQNVGFTFTSPDFSRFIGLYERDGTRITESFGDIASTQLAPGAYVILVSGRGDLGTYTLTSTVE